MQRLRKSRASASLMSCTDLPCLRLAAAGQVPHGSQNQYHGALHLLLGALSHPCSLPTRLPSHPIGIVCKLVILEEIHITIESQMLHIALSLVTSARTSTGTGIPIVTAIASPRTAVPALRIPLTDLDIIVTIVRRLTEETITRGINPRTGTNTGIIAVMIGVVEEGRRQSTAFTCTCRAERLI